MPEPRRRIHLSPPHLGSAEFDLLVDAYRSNWIAPLGPHVDGFEEEFARMVGGTVRPHAAALGSGTAALHLALRLVGVARGDEIFCSSFTFSASANPIVYEGARPVFVDSDLESWNMDPALLEAALSDRKARGVLPRAVIVVHLYGQCADLEPITAICERYGVALIEDAAETLGAVYFGSAKSREGATAGTAPGTVGKFGIFSFNGNKIITTSGGGMLVSRDEAAIKKARFLASQARDPAPHYQHSEIGFNYRLSNLLAAIGRGQLQVLSERVETRRRNFDAYVRSLRDLQGIAFMPEASYGRCTRWLTCITIDPRSAGTDRERVRLALEAENIESRPLWKPMHLQPVFAGCDVFGGTVSEGLFERGLCLPSGSSLTEEELARVVKAVRACWGDR